MTLDDIFQYVLPEVIGCPDPTLRNAVVQSAHDYCKRTLSWTEVLDPVYLLEGVNDYDIDVPTDAYLIAIRDVWNGVSKLTARNIILDGSRGTPAYYNQSVDRSMLRVYPTPASSGTTLTVRAAFAPKPTATTLPDYLSAYVIANGAKARLMMMPGTQWSNPQLGTYYSKMFEDDIITARIEEAHDRVPGSIVVEPRPFGFF